jgi:acyl dehydratase
MRLLLLQKRSFSYTRLNGLALSVAAPSSSSALSSESTLSVDDSSRLAGGGVGGSSGGDGGNAGSNRTLLQGIVLDHAVDLRNVRPGDQIEIPYELTLTETLQDFWFASFFDQSRIHTSRPFCRQMGLQDRVVPFSLALFLASSMSHADAAKVQVGFGNVHYLWPIFSGDTLRRTFTVNRIRNTSDGNHSVIHFTCDLINQRNRLCMRADKRMLFQFPVKESPVVVGEPLSSSSPTAVSPPASTAGAAVGPGRASAARGGASASPALSSQDAHLFRDHLLSKATTVLANQPSHSLSTLRAGDLILHSLHRSLTFSQSQQLASLARLTHPRHFDRRTYDTSSEILIPGGLVLGVALSACGRDLHEVLHEEIRSCAYVNALHPENVVGALSYVSNVDDNLPGDLELATVTTLGVKNVNAKRDLAGVGIPLELFHPGLFAKELEQICKESCPALSGKIVVQVERKILRQARHRQVFLL